MSEYNTVEVRNRIRDRLLDIATTPRYEGGTPSVDPDDEEAVAFTERALEEAINMLAANAERDPRATPEPTERAAWEEVDSLLVEDHIDHVDLRANGQYAAPKLTVWLNSAASKRWSNASERREIKFSQHREHYNGSPALVVVDVRPF